MLSRLLGFLFGARTRVRGLEVREDVLRQGIETLREEAKKTEVALQESIAELALHAARARRVAERLA